MSDLLRTPDRRSCERCGRVEDYDDSVWRAKRLGDVYCIHEWDIDGDFVPVTDGAPTPVSE